MAREDISSESIFKNITKLSGAPSPGPYDFARILDRRVNTNKREWKIFFLWNVKGDIWYWWSMKVNFYRWWTVERAHLVKYENLNNCWWMVNWNFGDWLTKELSKYFLVNGEILEKCDFRWMVKVIFCDGESTMAREGRHLFGVHVWTICWASRGFRSWILSLR